MCGQFPIHHLLRAQVVVLVEQCHHDLRWRPVDEARGRQTHRGPATLGFTKRPGGLNGVAGGRELTSDGGSRSRATRPVLGRPVPRRPAPHASAEPPIATHQLLSLACRRNPILVRERACVEHLPIVSPLGHELIHQCGKAVIVCLLKQVRQFVYQDVLKKIRRLLG